jgi:hypothetical protein
LKRPSVAGIKRPLSGKKNDIVISHAQLVQTGLDFFGKK